MRTIVRWLAAICREKMPLPPPILKNYVGVASSHEGRLCRYLIKKVCISRQDAAPTIYNNCQKYVPIDLAHLSKVIASEAKQSFGAP